jgi:hypothetical protein
LDESYLHSVYARQTGGGLFLVNRRSFSHGHKFFLLEWFSTLSKISAFHHSEFSERRQTMLQSSGIKNAPSHGWLGFVKNHRQSASEDGGGLDVTERSGEKS